jgi:hypothetical protein
VFAQRVRVRFRGRAAGLPLSVNFGALSVPNHSGRPDLDYRVGGEGSAFSVARSGQPPRRVGSAGDMLYLLEKSLTLELQRRRADLFFLHAAALARNGSAYLLVAEAGGGKSTLAWGLLHHGFGYLSDELAPVDVEGMEVHPYPRALCLKRPPCSPVPLPERTLDLGRTIHIPVRDLPGPLIADPRPVAAIFFLQYAPCCERPVLQPIPPAEAAARLYVNALNALAHPDRGLAPALRIAQGARCYTVKTGEVNQTCELIRAAVDAEASC